MLRPCGKYLNMFVNPHAAALIHLLSVYRTGTTSFVLCYMMLMLNVLFQEGDEMLNSIITLDEVTTSINKLALCTSCGNAGIGSEIYRYTVGDIGSLLCTLFNTIVEGGQFPKSWGESVICPIYKSGITCDPGNYRDITIITTMYKFCSTIIKSRLYSWAETNNKKTKHRRASVEVILLLIMFLFANYGTKVSI